MPRAEHHYQAQCEREGRAWIVDVPELRLHTFGRSLADAETMARDAVAGVLDVPMDTVSVALEVPGTAEPLREAHAAREALRRAAERAHAARDAAADALLRAGASRRDAARLLGVPPRRLARPTDDHAGRAAPGSTPHASTTAADASAHPVPS